MLLQKTSYVSSYIVLPNLQSCLRVKKGSIQPSQSYNIPHLAHWWLHASFIDIYLMGSLSLHNITILSSLFVRVLRLDFLPAHTYVTPCRAMRNYSKLHKRYLWSNIWQTRKNWIRRSWSRDAFLAFVFIDIRRHQYFLTFTIIYVFIRIFENIRSILCRRICLSRCYRNIQANRIFYPKR